MPGVAITALAWIAEQDHDVFRTVQKEARRPGRITTGMRIVARDTLSGQVLSWARQHGHAGSPGDWPWLSVLFLFSVLEVELVGGAKVGLWSSVRGQRLGRETEPGETARERREKTSRN